MRRHCLVLCLGIFLLGNAFPLWAQEKDKKVSFFYPEDFFSCTGVDNSSGLFSSPQDTFNVLRDESVFVWLSLKYVAKESKTVKFVWYSPKGDKYHESKPVTLNQEQFYRKYARIWQQIGIRDLDKLGLLGQWRVVAVVDNKPLEKDAKFTLVR